VGIQGTSHGGRRDATGTAGGSSRGTEIGLAQIQPHIPVANEIYLPLSKGEALKMWNTNTLQEGYKTIPARFAILE
jgi:hypothetical protein